MIDQQVYLLCISSHLNQSKMGLEYKYDSTMQYFIFVTLSMELFYDGNVYNMISQ